MRKLIAAINMSLDGFCDHTAMSADSETHDHYTELIRSADTLVYGRITYLLMENFWPTLVKQPSGEQSLDEFAAAIDSVDKLVFSHTLKKLEWDNARIANGSIEEEITALKQQSGRAILVGSPSLIVSTMNLQLVDELQICVHPVIVGKGLSLLKNISERLDLKLIKTKTFRCGAVIFYYEPIKNNH